MLGPASNRTIIPLSMNLVSELKIFTDAAHLSAYIFVYIFKTVSLKCKIVIRKNILKYFSNDVSIPSERKLAGSLFLSFETYAYQKFKTVLQ